MKKSVFKLILILIFKRYEIINMILLGIRNIFNILIFFININL